MVNVGDLRLTIEAPALFIGQFRYTVLRRFGPNELFAIIDFGNKTCLRDAMTAAEQVAAELTDGE